MFCIYLELVVCVAVLYKLCLTVWGFVEDFVVMARLFRHFWYGGRLI